MFTIYVIDSGLNSYSHVNELIQKESIKNIDFMKNKKVRDFDFKFIPVLFL